MFRVDIGKHGPVDIIAILPTGMGDWVSKDGEGAVVSLEVGQDWAKLYVWADINQEQETHVIDISGAFIHRRE